MSPDEVRERKYGELEEYLVHLIKWSLLTIPNVSDETKKHIDGILLDYLVNNSSDALIETVLDMYPDEVREKLR